MVAFSGNGNTIKLYLNLNLNSFKQEGDPVLQWLNPGWKETGKRQRKETQLKKGVN